MLYGSQKRKHFSKTEPRPWGSGYFFFSYTVGHYWVHLLFVIGIRQNGSVLTETNYGEHIPIKDNDRVLEPALSERKPTLSAAEGTNGRVAGAIWCGVMARPAKQAVAISEIINMAVEDSLWAKSAHAEINHQLLKKGLYRIDIGPELPALA